MYNGLARPDMYFNKCANKTRKKLINNTIIKGVHEYGHADLGYLPAVIPDSLSDPFAEPEVVGVPLAGDEGSIGLDVAGHRDALPGPPTPDGANSPDTPIPSPADSVPASPRGPPSPIPLPAYSIPPLRDMGIGNDFAGGLDDGGVAWADKVLGLMRADGAVEDVAADAPLPVIAPPDSVDAPPEALPVVVAGPAPHPLVTSWNPIPGIWRKESAFKNLSEVQIRLYLKYGLDHIKTTVTSNSILSIRRRGVEDLFRPLEDAIKPKVAVTMRLMEDLKGDADELSNQMCSVLGTVGLPEAQLEPDMGTLQENASLGNAAPAPREVMDFFKVVHKTPNQLLGQRSDAGVEWKKGEVVVAQQAFFMKDIQKHGDAFLYTDPGERQQDLQLVAPGDALLCRLMLWRTDPEKHYWDASLMPDEMLRRGAIVALKTLMDAHAIEGGDIVHNVSNSEEDTIKSLMELERLGLVVRTTTGGAVSGWMVLKKAAETLEPISRIHSPKLILKKHSEKTAAEQSLLGLVDALERDGWEHKEWDPANDPKPRAVDVHRPRPKHFYSKVSSSGHPICSKLYLQTLLSIQDITCHPVVEHCEKDAHYRWLLSNGTKEKKRKRNPIESDAGDLTALMDAPLATRRRGGRGGGTTRSAQNLTVNKLIFRELCGS